MTYNRLALNVIKFYIVCMAIMASVGMLRLLDIFNTAVLIRFVVPLCFLFTLVLFHHKLSARFRVNSFILFGFLMCIYGVLIGILRRQDTYFIVADTMTIFIAFVSFFVFYSNGDFDIKSLENVISFGSYAILIGSLINILIAYAIIAIKGRTFYLAFGDLDMILPMAWFLLKKQKKPFVISVILILMSVKVGAIISMCSVLLLHYFLSKNYSLSKVAIGFVVMFMLFNVCMYYGRNVDLGGGTTNVVNDVFSKLQGYNYYSLNESDKNSEDFGGSRVAEIYYSLDKLSQYEMAPYLFGAGHGFVYDGFYMGESFEKNHNVHVSPISLLTKYGAVFTALFYCFIFSALGRAYKFFYSNKEVRSYQLMFYFCFGSIVFSFTAYSLFVNLLFWFFLGILMRKIENNSFVQHEIETAV